MYGPRKEMVPWIELLCPKIEASQTAQCSHFRDDPARGKGIVDTVCPRKVTNAEFWYLCEQGDEM